MGSDKFEYVGLGNTARDVWLKKLIDELNQKIEQAVDAAFSLTVTENSDGTITLSLLDHDDQVLNIGTINLTKNIIKSAEVDYENEVIKLICLDDSVIECDISDLLDTLNNKVDKVSGKGLSKNDFTNELKEKLEIIGYDAQANVIEDVKVDGVSLEIVDKSVNIDLSGKVDKVDGKGLSSNDYTTADRTKLAGIEPGAQVNVITNVKVDGHTLPITDGSVNIDLSDKVDKVNGKGLSTNDFTDSYREKLDDFEKGAQVNAIERITVDGHLLPIVDKEVNVDLSGKVDKVAGKGLSTNDFNNDYKYQLDNLNVDIASKVDKVPGKGLSEADFTNLEKEKLEGIESEAQVNIIEQIRVDGVPLTVYGSAKYVDITLADKVDTTPYNNRVYGTSQNGQQTTYGIDLNNADYTVNNVVRRFIGGNISVPTQPTNANDATSKQYVDAFGKNLLLSLDNTDYTLSATLVDGVGNVIANRVVDLPLENDIISGSFDSESNCIILNQINGGTQSIDISSLISGLQSEITANSKLASDLVDDSLSVHKFATAAQLTQIQTNTTNIALKANSSDVYTKAQSDTLLASKANSNEVYTITQVNSLLANKQDALATQNAFINKGTAVKIPSISTNSYGQVTNIQEINIDALPSSTRYCTTLESVFNPVTYTVTLSIKDQTGQILGTPQEINLPKQTIITNGYYDSVTSSIILILTDGQQISIPVSDMVQGLVPTSRQIAGLDLVDDIGTDELLGRFFTVTDGVWENVD